MAKKATKDLLFPLPADLDFTSPNAVAVVNDRLRRIGASVTNTNTKGAPGVPGPAGPSGAGVVNVLTLGAAGDCRAVTDAAMTSGSPTVSSATAGFTAGDVGKIFCIGGAGAAGIGIKDTIVSVADSTHADIGVNASTTTSGQTAFWGTDDTTVIQGALDSTAGGQVIFPDQMYLIDPFVMPAGKVSDDHLWGLRVSSGTTLTFLGNATLRAMATDSPAYAIINLNNVQDITIDGGILIGERKVHLAAGGGSNNEDGFGIFMQTAKNVTVYFTVMQDCWGDGSLVYGGAATDDTRQPCQNIQFYSPHCDNNRRQGISIASVIACSIFGGMIENTNGTSPERGIDIEPDSGADFIDGVYISGLTTRANCGGGIIITPIRLCDAAGKTMHVLIDGWTSLQDACGSATIEPDRPTGAFRGESQPALTFANAFLDDMDNPVAGQITVRNVHIVEPGIHGVGFTNWSSYMPSVLLDKVRVTNPNRTASGPLAGSGDDAAVPDGGIADLGWSIFENALASVCGFVIGQNTDTTSIVPTGASAVYTGHIDLINCVAEDTRSTQILIVGFYSHTNDTSSLYIDASFTDCLTFASPGTQNINWNGGAGIETYTKKPIQTLANGDSPIAGYDIQPTEAAVIQLPTAAEVIGREFFFTNPGAYALQLRPDAADTIGPSGVFGIEPGNDLVMNSLGDHVKLKSAGGNTWTVQASYGDVTARSFFPFGRRLGGRQEAGMPLTLVPDVGPGLGGTTGLYVRGDYIENNLPNAGFYQGIVCVSGGTGSSEGGTNAAWEKVGPIQAAGIWHYTDPTEFNNEVRFMASYGAINADSTQLVIGGGGSTPPDVASMSWGNAGGSCLNFGTGSSGVFEKRFTFVDSGQLTIFASGPTQIFNLATDGTVAITGPLQVQGTATGLYSGSGSPASVVGAKLGSIFMRTDGGSGSSVYIKESDDGGNTGWIALGGGATGAAGGDLSGTYPNPTVATVGSSSASNIHTAEVLANAATSGNTANAIVKRNGSGDIAIHSLFLATGGGVTVGSNTGVTSSHAVIESVSTETIVAASGLSLTVSSITVGGFSVVQSVTLNQTVNTYTNVCNNPSSSTYGFEGGIRTT